ncbi:MAG: chorismate--pyruvate lyase [Eubacterium sp.]|nr:chorismate--pyruvate lyase [Eubacterium sp.]
MNLQTMYFVVVKIDGDYAHLQRTDEAQDELKLVARALLPYDIVEGTMLKYEMLQYEIIG